MTRFSIHSKRKITDMTKGLSQNGIKLRQALIILYTNEDASVCFCRQTSERHVRGMSSYARRQSSMF